MKNVSRHPEIDPVPLIIIRCCDQSDLLVDTYGIERGNHGQFMVFFFPDLLCKYVCGTCMY